MKQIWVTGSKYNRRSAAIMWPGSAAVNADYIVPFNKESTPMDEINAVLELVDKPYEKRPHFFSVYMHHVDTDGHIMGPDGSGITLSIKLVDQAVGYLMDELKKRNLDEYYHIVVVSFYFCYYISGFFFWKKKSIFINIVFIPFYHFRLVIMEWQLLTIIFIMMIFYQKNHSAI